MLCFRCLRTAQVQSNHAVTNAVSRIRVDMEVSALSYATTPNTSLPARALLDISVNFVRGGWAHLVSRCTDEKDRSCMVYQLLHPETSSLYEVFCDSMSENGFVWTLVESFSLANKVEFASKAFCKNYPVNQSSFSWNNFLLSWHVRATCNFNPDGLNYTDNLRAKLSDIDMLRLMFNGCKKYEYINIRGYRCNNCTAHFCQKDYFHAHIDSYHGSKKGCNLTIPGAVDETNGEDNFGSYGTINHVHRCSTNNSSTTQWWLGEQ